eukprot:scaffold65885_cov35-Tisochrysis_lutea.AAC.1
MAASPTPHQPSSPILKRMTPACLCAPTRRAPHPAYWSFSYSRGPQTAGRTWNRCPRISPAFRAATVIDAECNCGSLRACTHRLRVELAEVGQAAFACNGAQRVLIRRYVSATVERCRFVTVQSSCMCLNRLRAGSVTGLTKLERPRSTKPWDAIVGHVMQAALSPIGQAHAVGGHHGRQHLYHNLCGSDVVEVVCPSLGILVGK